MSQHAVRTQRRENPVLVVAGFDPRKRSLYLQVWDDPEAHRRWDQVVLYASHLDARRDWSDIDSVAQALDALSIAVPAGFLDALQEDQAGFRSDRIRHHWPASSWLLAPSA